MVDIAASKTKFGGHETFFIRKGWLSKGLQAVQEKNDIFIDKNINPMDVLGIGANMVKSLRYWLQATGLTEEPDKGRRIQCVSEIGQIINDNDPYFEELLTLWVLHYRLINNKKLATSWYFFFNFFTLQSFSQEDFVRAIESFAVNTLNISIPARRTSEDDFRCILGTYLSKDHLQFSKVSPENNIDCPFGELELLIVDSAKDKLYRKHHCSAELFSSWACLYAILSYRDEFRADDYDGSSSALTFEELLNAPGSPGRAFNFDSLTLLEILRRLENQGYIRVIRTAGIDEVRIDTTMSALACLEKGYAELE